MSAALGCPLPAGPPLRTRANTAVGAALLARYSYYREHTHALASGIDAGAIMAELFAKDGGTCRGTGTPCRVAPWADAHTRWADGPSTARTAGRGSAFRRARSAANLIPALSFGAGGSMHIYDVDTHFQGGWALVSEQLPYAAGAARSIKLDRELGLAPEGDDRMAVVFCGEGGSQNGRMVRRRYSMPPPRHAKPRASRAAIAPCGVRAAAARVRACRPRRRPRRLS